MPNYHLRLLDSNGTVLGGRPTIAGLCDDSAYTGAAQLGLQPFADGTQATVQLLLLCV